MREHGIEQALNFGDAFLDRRRTQAQRGFVLGSKGAVNVVADVSGGAGVRQERHDSVHVLRSRSVQFADLVRTELNARFVAKYRLRERKRVGWGKRGYICVDTGGGR